MAINEVFDNHPDKLSAVATHPTTPTLGGPARLGQLPMVCIVTEGTDGIGTYAIQGVYDLSVKAIDAGGNSAVAVGDIIYYTDADTPPLSKKATGVRFGYALEAITSGSTDTINVLIGY